MGKSLSELLKEQREAKERAKANDITIRSGEAGNNQTDTQIQSTANSASAAQTFNSSPTSIEQKSAKIAKAVEAATVSAAKPVSALDRLRGLAKGIKSLESLATVPLKASPVVAVSETPVVKEQPKIQAAIVAENDIARQEKAIGHRDAEKKNDGTADVESLRRNLDYLANNIEQKELVGQVVRTIATQLKNAPELVPFMRDQDVDLVVKGLRRAFNVAARKKTETKEKKTKATGMEVDLMQSFKDAGFGGLG